MKRPAYNPILLPELREMLAAGDLEGIEAVLRELHPATIAEFTEGLDPSETWALLAFAPADRQAEVFTYYSMPKQVELIEEGDLDHVATLLDAMPSDDRADLMQELDPNLVERLLPMMSKEDRHDVRMLMSYPDDSAGSVMTTDFAWLPDDVTVSEAIPLLREQAADSETIYYVYVIDKERRLVGIISLRDLILARPDARIRDLMKHDAVFARVTDDREEVAKQLARYNFLALPIVDEQHRLVGIVTHDDVIDVVIEEATEDALRMGAVGAMVEHFLDAPFAVVWRKRAVWLSLLFVAELMTFGAMAYFEEALAAITALAFFVPLCISTGGNSGAQAATLITRAMALNQVSPGDWWNVVRHEVAMGLVLGLTLGSIALVQVILTPERILNYDPAWKLGVVVGLSVTFICLWGTLVGSLLPLGFEKIGFDPGYASSPFVATLVDVTGIIIYFSIAMVVLHP